MGDLFFFYLKQYSKYSRLIKTFLFFTSLHQYLILLRDKIGLWL